MCLGSPLEGQHRGLPKTPVSTIGEGGLPPHFQVSQCDSRKSQGGVASVGASPWGTSPPKRVGVEAVLLRMARMFQEWPWVSWWGGASVGASLRMPHGGEASDGASPCQSKGQAKGVLGW